MSFLKKIPAFTAGVLFLGLIHLQAWALDKTDFQALDRPVDEQTLSAFAAVPLYYLESPPGIRYAQKAETEPGEETESVIHFFFDRPSAEIFQDSVEKTSRQASVLKKISMASILKAMNSQSKSQTPDSWKLVISAGSGSEKVFFYHLIETASGKPYTLEFKRKRIIPAFVSKEAAESMAKIITASGSVNISTEENNFSGFLDFLKNQPIPIRVFPYASQPRYTEIRPMTWGVGSSYLFGTALVLFLLWAITRSTKHK